MNTTEKAKIIERLRNDDEYYGEFGKQFMSNSYIYNLMHDPSNFKVFEKSVPLLQGDYFHKLLLEPEKADVFTIIDASRRNTKVYKEALEEHGEDMLLLRSEADEMKVLADKIRNNAELSSIIYADGTKYEEPNVMELEGMMWKCKTDVDNPELIVDIKTTANLDKFRRSAYMYNYDSQAYIAREMFGKHVIFIVACKSTGRLGLFESSSDFYMAGMEKVEKAVERYDMFFGENPTHDVNNYVFKDVL